MFGRLPGRSSQDVWFGLQFRLEQAHLQNEPLCGVTTDLEKAFNFLPRTPVFAFAAHLGLPMPVIRAWTAAVSMLQRRFKVRGCVGPPISSLTGFPEGDPMSCTAMALVCLAFARAWDLTLDRSKTVYWATQAEDRRWFRARGAPVIHQARYTPGLQSHYLPGQTWSRDGRRVASRSVWDFHLYFGLEVHLYPSHCCPSRFGRPGANAAVHLALVEPPKADPGFVVFRSSVVDFRTQLRPQEALSVLDHLASSPLAVLAQPVPSVSAFILWTGSGSLPAKAGCQSGLPPPWFRWSAVRRSCTHPSAPTAL